jgi:hypothetical protein
MNKLLENIEAKMTENRYVFPSPLEEISYTETYSNQGPIDISLNTLREMRIEVRIGAYQMIEEKYIGTTTGEFIMQELKEKMGYAIAEHIYGDIRRKLIELEYTTRREGIRHNSDTLKIIDELHKMVTYGRY